MSDPVFTIRFIFIAGRTSWVWRDAKHRLPLHLSTVPAAEYALPAFSKPRGITLHIFSVPSIEQRVERLCYKLTNAVFQV